MAYCYQGHIEKIPILEEILKDAQLDPEQVAAAERGGGGHPFLERMAGKANNR